MKYTKTRSGTTFQSLYAYTVNHTKYMLAISHYSYATGKCGTEYRLGFKKIVEWGGSMDKT